jgi:hypothetical protein
VWVACVTYHNTANATLDTAGKARIDAIQTSQNL